jgi:hypothetical protein
MFASYSTITYGEITDIDTINEIDIKINNAFEAILESEKTGADITALIRDINEAIIIFKEFKIAIKEGDSERAILTSQECVSIVTKVENEAHALSVVDEDQIISSNERRYLISRGGMIIIIILSLIIWYKVKDYYMNRTLKMKPRVVNIES